MSPKCNNNDFPISCVSQYSTTSYENKKPLLLLTRLKVIIKTIKINNRDFRVRLSDRRLV